MTETDDLTSPALWSFKGFAVLVHARTGVNLTRGLVREMEASKSISPAVCDAGWRMFSLSDLESAVEWIDARRSRRYRA